MRLGIHSGPLLAGVIGKKKFTYDVWGDSVNTAARMESSSLPGAINISQSTFELVKDFFDCEHRGKIAAKNKGYVDMYLVNGIKKHLALDPLGLLPNDKFNDLYLAI
jgi:class 3 adenylate cyclase